jgi:serine beta-lactamase-like protein LACTB
MTASLVIRRRRIVLSAVLLFSIVPAILPPVLAQTGAVLDSVRAFVQAEVARQSLPGLSIAVVVDDQLVWSQGFGFADLESGDRATGSTLYRIGSVSKPIVGTALMQLVEQGRVDLDADIRTYIPQWPAKPWTITVRHLVTHTSGIRHYRGDEFNSMVHYDDLVAPLEIFKDDPLLFEPGTRYSYSTYGFNLVANIVENVSGLPIDVYMREHVFEPAWMNETGLEEKAVIHSGRAAYYDRDREGRLVNSPYADLSNKYAGGGITSTVEDLCRLHIAYARGRMMKPETEALMYTNQPLKDGSLGDYGLCWRVEQARFPDGGSARLVSHSGGSMGHTTLFHRFPDQGFAVAIISNVQGGVNLGRIMNGVTLLFRQAGSFQHVRRRP